MKQFIKKIIKSAIKNIILYFIPSDREKDKFSYEQAEKILHEHYPDLYSSPLCKNKSHERTYDLTVIVPVYNVEKYLKVCLDSLRNQKTNYAYHVVAVNDGATDSSGEILEMYSSWSELTIINQKNRGLSGARNTGLQEVFGKYIMFLDSDDYLAENAVESLMHAAYFRNADIVQGGYIHVTEDGNRHIGGMQYSDSTNVAPNGVVAGMAWGKIYKTDLFSELCFPEGYWYEDSIITGIVTHLATSIATISDNVYFYRKNTAGITHMSKGRPKSLDTFYVLRSTLNARKQLNMYTDCAFYEHLLRIIPLCAKRIENEPKQVQRAMFVMFKKMLKEERADSKFEVHPKYRMLEKVILSGDFRKYCLLCIAL